MSKIRFATLNHEFHKIFMYYKLINIFNVSLTGNNPKDGISKGNGSKRGSKTSTSDKKIQFDSECNVNYYLRKNSDKKLSTGRDLEQGIPHREDLSLQLNREKNSTCTPYISTPNSVFVLPLGDKIDISPEENKAVLSDEPEVYIKEIEERMLRCQKGYG